MVEPAVQDAHATLPQGDIEYLEEKQHDHQLVSAGGDIHVILHGFDLGAAYEPAQADLLVIIPAGYPEAHPDMFWTRPDVRLARGGVPLKADGHGAFPSGRWQRWSRHFRGKWRPGVDNLRTYLAAVHTELARGL